MFKFLKKRHLKKAIQVASESKFICGNCGISENIRDLNVRENSKLFSAEVFITTTRKIPYGLHIYPLICFECNHFTEWAPDGSNFSGRAIGGVEYFNNHKISQEIVDKAKEYAQSSGLHIPLKKLDKLQPM